MIQRNRSTSWKTEQWRSLKLKTKKKIKRNEESLRQLWNNIMQTNIHIARIPEREEREEDSESIFEDIIAENSPNSGKETDIQVQEDTRCLRQDQRTTPRHTIIKMKKKKKRRILNMGREKQQVTYKGDSQVTLQQKFCRPEGSGQEPWKLQMGPLIGKG